MKRTETVRMVLGLGAGLVLLASCREEPPTKKAVIRPVRAIKIADTKTFSSRSFPGRAAATQEVNLAFEVPGRLVERPVDVGTEVTKDQLLARLDPSDFQNTLEAAKARRKQAEAYRDRIAQAAKTGAVAQQQLTDRVPGVSTVAFTYTSPLGATVVT